MPVSVVTALVLSCGFATVYGAMLVRKPVGSFRSVVKTLPVFLLALAVALSGGPLVLILGLLLGAVGDFCLSRNGESYFLAGLGAFLLGHIAFVILFIETGEGIRLIFEEHWRILAGFILLTISAIMTMVLYPRLGTLRIPVLTYIAVIVLMGVAALLLPAEPVIWWAIAGAAMFIASDAILSAELFLIDDTSPARKLTAPILWFLYWGGQFLIGLSMM